MKIYFSASIHGLSHYQEHYRYIADAVKKAGHRLDVKHVLDVTSDDLRGYSDEEHYAFYRDVHNHLKAAEALFVEVSYTSTSTGFMIAEAINMGKPVVIFFSGKEEPHLFKTLEKVNERVMVVRYRDIADLDKDVPRALAFVSESQDVRFNFFIAAKHTNYLNWVSKNKRIPRSVYLRRLIDEHMKDHESQEHDDNDL